MPLAKDVISLSFWIQARRLLSTLVVGFPGLVPAPKPRLNLV
jgi:hypothetical protein